MMYYYAVNLIVQIFKMDKMPLADALPEKEDKNFPPTRSFQKHLCFVCALYSSIAPCGSKPIRIITPIQWQRRNPDLLKK